MTTSLKEWSAYVKRDLKELTEADKTYFRAATRRHVYGVVLEKFMNLSEEEGFSRADLARKLRARPSQITRWLSSPGNWTLDTISDLLLAMSCRAHLTADDLADVNKGNYAHKFSTIGREQTPIKVEARSDDRTTVIEIDLPSMIRRADSSTHEAA